MRALPLGVLSSVSFAALTLGLAAPAHAQVPQTAAPGGDPCQVPSDQVDKSKCPDANQTDGPTTAEGAAAQENIQNNVPGAGTTGEDIVVTGSRIRRDAFNTGENVTIITREESKQAGFNSTTETLQSNAVTSGSAQIDNRFSGFVTDGGPGANTVSLRGLGATRTLVLLNGRRVAPAGTRGSVGSADLNVLPTAIIDRIEVLKAGASSVYGSDAIAGVINVVTRNNFSGLTGEAQVSVPETGQGTSKRLALVGGIKSGSWRLSGALEMFDRDQVNVGDRPFARCQTDFLRTATNPEFGSGDFIDPATGQPKCFTLNRQGSQGVTVNTIGLGGPVVLAPGNTFQNAGVELAPGFVVPAGQSVLCNRFRFDAAAQGTVPGLECVNGLFLNASGVPVAFSNINIRDTFDPRQLGSTLINPVRNYTGYVQGGLDVGGAGDAELYFELLGSQRESKSTSFRQLTLDYGEGSPLIPALLAQFPSFLPAGSSVVLPSTQATDVRLFVGAGLLSNDQRVRFFRGNVGLRGDFFVPDWKYDVNLSQSLTNARYGQRTFLTDRVAQSLQATGSVATGFQCVNPANGCVAAPFITPDVVAGNLPANYLNFIVQRDVGTTKFYETTLTGGVDGPLFRLPGGDASAFVGFEHRRSRINDTPGPNSQAGNLYNLSSATPTRGSDRVNEVFGEIELPIARRVPMAYDLTLNGSARYTRYRSYGSGRTWKLSFNYAPERFIAFRGNIGTSYRAPALFEQFLGATSGFLSQASDPCNNYTAPNVTETRRANCASENLPTSFQATQGITVLGGGGAASGLEAETSKSWSYGAVFQPSLGRFGSLSLAADYFNTEVNNGVSRLGGANLLSLCYDDPAFRTGDSAFCPLVSRATTATRALTVLDNYINVSDDVVRGIDFNGRYEVPIGDVRFRLGAQVTRFLDQANRTFAGQRLLDANGSLFNPEWSGNFEANVGYKRLDLNYGVDWTSGQSDLDFLVKNFNLNPATEFRQLETPDYYLHRASARLRFDDFTMVFGVRNLFDKEPPRISTGRTGSLVGNAPLYSGYDILGRTFFLNVTTNLSKIGQGLGL
jgi:outer membrane receptor protein involved in Fe transport